MGSVPDEIGHDVTEDFNPMGENVFSDDDEEVRPLPPRKTDVPSSRDFSSQRNMISSPLQ